MRSPPRPAYEDMATRRRFGGQRVARSPLLLRGVTVALLLGTGIRIVKLNELVPRGD